MEPERSGSRACQRCGAARDGTRFCSTCGLDFWRAAADETRPPAAEGSIPVPVSPRSTLSVGMVAIGVGALLLVLAGGLWWISGADLLPSNDPPAVASRPPVHPILAAFFREARAPDAAFALEQVGTVSLSGPVEESYDLRAHGRLYADDWIMRLRIAGESAEIQGDVAVVDGLPYARESGGEWIVGDELSAAEEEPANPFARISTVGELEYIGRERRGGVDGHLIATEKWLGAPNSDPIMRALGRITDREARMEILVTDLGVPILAEYTFRAEGTSRGEEVVMSGTTSFTFSDWDLVEPIEPPIPEP